MPTIFDVVSRASDTLTPASRHSVTAGETVTAQRLPMYATLLGCDGVTPAAQSVPIRSRTARGNTHVGLRNEVAIPDPHRGAQSRLRRELAQVTIVAGAVDPAFLCDNLRGRSVDLLPEHVGPLIDNRGVGGALLDGIVPCAGEDGVHCGFRIHHLSANTYALIVQFTRPNG